MDESSPPRSKVQRLIREYDLDGMGAELEERWTRSDDRYSLRRLAEWFNKRLVERRLSSASDPPLDGELDDVYTHLTDGEVSRADRVQVRRRLERVGLDPRSLREDFVSYQAVRTYLQDVRGAEQPDCATDPRTSVKRRLQRLQGRTATVSETQLEDLRRAGRLNAGPLRTLVDIQVLCERCGTQYDVVELLERGECDCSDAA